MWGPVVGMFLPGGIIGNHLWGQQGGAAPQGRPGLLQQLFGQSGGQQQWGQQQPGWPAHHGQHPGWGNPQHQWPSQGMPFPGQQQWNHPYPQQQNWGYQQAPPPSGFQPQWGQQGTYPRPPHRYYR